MRWIKFFYIAVILVLTACSANPLPTQQNDINETPSTEAGTGNSTIASVTPSPTPQPETRLQIGEEALFNGNNDLAESQFQAVLDGSTSPDIKAAALWGLGRVESRGGNKAKALIDLNNLASTYPDSINAARAYYLMGEIYSDLGRYPEAATAYATFLEKRPGIIDFDVQRRLGDAYASSGNFTAAITAYQAALDAPHIGDDTSLQITLAKSYASSGDYQTALARYDEIASASSNDYVKAQMDFLSGQIYYSAGQTDEAYQRFLHAVDNYPLAYDSYSALVTLVNDGVPVDEMSRGLTDYFAGQYGYALAAFQRYLSANPNNDGTVYYYIALASREIDEYQQAVNAFDTLIYNYPENRYWQLAWEEKTYTLWSGLGQYEAAAQTMLDYASQYPDSTYVPQALLSAGQIYERDNQLENAARTWESLADLQPGSDLVPQALFLAGIARFRLGNLSQALLTFQRDLLLSNSTEDQARAGFWMGKTEQALGDPTAAQASWQQAASLDATDYYSLRAQDMLLNQPAFASPAGMNFTVDLASERTDAEAWMRITFNLPAETDLDSLGDLSTDGRLVRGTEFWELGQFDEARSEFENLRTTYENDPAESFRLANTMLELGLYRPAITAFRQVLALAGMATQLQTLAAPPYFNHVRYGLYYQDLILASARQNEMNPLFLFSVVRQESLFEGFVRSTAGARGLMQIIPSTGQYIVDTIGWPPGYTSDDLYLPYINIPLGAHYLRSNQTNLDGNIYAALAAYNGGPGNASQWVALSGQDIDLLLEVIRFQETRDYIRGIYENYRMYTSLYGTLP